MGMVHRDVRTLKATVGWMRRHSEIAVASKMERLRVQISDVCISKEITMDVTYGLTKS